MRWHGFAVLPHHRFLACHHKADGFLLGVDEVLLAQSAELEVHVRHHLVEEGSVSLVRLPVGVGRCADGQEGEVNADVEHHEPFLQVDAHLMPLDEPLDGGYALQIRLHGDALLAPSAEDTLHEGGEKSGS